MSNDEVVLRRRAGDGAIELRINGVFVMDNHHTESERLLAEHVLSAGAREVLVGGLGLGFTARELLNGGADRIIVAELHAEIAQAMRTGQIPGADLLDDPRLQLVTADVKRVVSAQRPRSLDAILLDVDNGPDHLVYESNADIYQSDFFGECADALRDAGQLSVWSMADSPAVRSALLSTFTSITVTEVPIQLQQRRESFWLLTADRPVRR